MTNNTRQNPSAPRRPAAQGARPAARRPASQPQRPAQRAAYSAQGRPVSRYARRRQRQRQRMLLIAGLAVAVVLLIVLIVSLVRGGRSDKPVTPAPVQTETTALTTSEDALGTDAADSLGDTEGFGEADTFGSADEFEDADFDDAGFSDEVAAFANEVDGADTAATDATTSVDAAAAAADTASDAAPVTGGSEYPSTYQILPGVPNTDHPLGVGECPQVADSYFDDAVFIGDSISLKMKYFVRDYRNSSYADLLGKAQFLTAGSLGSGNAMQNVSEDSVHPTYQGTKMLLEDAVAAMGAKKVYIMLGMNDVAIYGAEQSAQNLMKLAKRIRDKSPDCKIFVQSATPRLKGNYGKLNNNTLFEYDLKLFEYCQQFKDNGIYFIDIGYMMRDEEGNLPASYCSDPDAQRIHFTDKACKIWIKYLYTHVPA